MCLFVPGLLREGHLSGEAMQDFYSKVYDGVNLEVAGSEQSNCSVAAELQRRH